MLIVELWRYVFRADLGLWDNIAYEMHEIFMYAWRDSEVVREKYRLLTTAAAAA